jgi:uncharacterized membrane protein
MANGQKKNGVTKEKGAVRQNKDGQPIMPSKKNASPSARAADRVTAIVGSWWFLGIQSVILMLWVYLNIIAWVYHWDPYPFILLNLTLSFQAAFTAPVILMSQNRQSEIDRQRTEYDYMIDRKAEREIHQMHKELKNLRRALDEYLIRDGKKKK